MKIKRNLTCLICFYSRLLPWTEKNTLCSTNNVLLHPIDVSYNDLKKLNNNSDFNPADLDNKISRQNLLPLFYK